MTPYLITHIAAQRDQPQLSRYIQWNLTAFTLPCSNSASPPAATHPAASRSRHWTTNPSLHLHSWFRWVSSAGSSPHGQLHLSTADDAIAIAVPPPPYFVIISQLVACGFHFEIDEQAAIDHHDEQHSGIHSKHPIANIPQGLYRDKPFPIRFKALFLRRELESPPPSFAASSSNLVLFRLGVDGTAHEPHE